MATRGAYNILPITALPSTYRHATSPRPNIERSANDSTFPPQQAATPDRGSCRSRQTFEKHLTPPPLRETTRFFFLLFLHGVIFFLANSHFVYIFITFTRPPPPPPASQKTKIKILEPFFSLSFSLSAACFSWCKSRWRRRHPPPLHLKRDEAVCSCWRGWWWLARRQQGRRSESTAPGCGRRRRPSWCCRR